MNKMAWPPRTESELRDALAEGLLVESHHCDLKQEIGSGTGANRDIAIDLAAFAVDGGHIFIGIKEAEGVAKALHPIALEGLKERIDNIAQSRIQEALSVRCTEIPTETDSTRGYLVVIVPPSPARPHMVDGKYRGRGDTTNRVLPDSEVVRLHRERSLVERRIDSILQEEIARDPTATIPDMQNEAHIFICALPVMGSLQLMLDAMPKEPSEQTLWIREKILNGQAGAQMDPDWAPGFSDWQVHFRANGWAAYDESSMTSARTIQRIFNESHLFDLELGEDGSLRVLCGRGSYTEKDQRFAIEYVIAGLTKRVVTAAKVISDECNYFDGWDFGLAVTNIKGSKSAALLGRQRGVISLMETFPSYSEQDYRQNTQATYEQLISDTDEVVEKLFGRLNRGLNQGRVSIPKFIADRGRPL
jgi:hypothetical protein